MVRGDVPGRIFFSCALSAIIENTEILPVTEATMNINEARLYAAFKTLAQIPSPSWHEEKVIDWLEGFAKKRKINFKKIPCRKSFNVLMTIDATDALMETLLFSGHTDTVPPCDKINVVETETKFTSDGTSILGGDDKAAIAAFLEAIEIMRESKVPHGTIHFLLTCAEEVGLEGMKGMDFAAISPAPKYAFVLDMGGPIGTACVKAPWHTATHVTVFGKAAHAGMEPEKGKNAIKAMAAIIAALPDGRIDEETTCNVGLVRGGSATNIVPAEASFDCEARSQDKAKLAALDKKMAAAIKDAAKKEGVKVAVSSILEYPGYAVKANAPICRLFEKACGAIALKPQFIGAGGGSDVNILRAAKIDAINVSVGMIKVHTTAEELKKSDLCDSCRLVLSIIQSA